MSNEYGYGIHTLGTRTCPNCGSATERFSFTTPASGVNANRCYTCAPVWAEILAPIALLTLTAGLAVLCVTILADVFWPLGISAIGAVMLAIASWPRWRTNE